MKKRLLSLSILFSLAVGAQTKEGKVVYERTIQMQIRIQGMDEEAARRLPRSRTDNFELLFANNQSLWQQLPNADEEANSFGGGGGGGNIMRFNMGMDDIIYLNFETAKRIDKRELNSKSYLVEDSIRKLSWKLTGETKTILGHAAQKATAQRYGKRPQMNMENGVIKRQEVADTSAIVAWFTTDIPVPAGPEFGGQLPGLILELDINKGRIAYKAVELSPKVNTASIKEPKGGKHISAEEYQKESQKVMDEMMKNMPNFGGNRQIRIAG